MLKGDCLIEWRFKLDKELGYGLYLIWDAALTGVFWTLGSRLVSLMLANEDLRADTIPLPIGVIKVHGIVY